ncbi:hypothetical protein [Polaribacter sp. AHE13PA]|uniref:hypothetical protein n=1 Tax=Polaribacter sp. AHE13PA TaxID=2745562 RepID=UPI001C4FCBE2|nr:hypothetical protein [Polaribacter sp. AHE13PA]QXP65756.1 hypothetical protein H0I28_11155 [Polaribacter sp. AHE13PA]
MKIKNLFKTVICLLTLSLTFSCSSDDDSMKPPTDNSNFTTNSNTDFFINFDGTVNLIVSGTFQEDSGFGTVTDRGFVYGTSSNPEVGANNTSGISGNNSDATGYIENLTSGQTYFIRGYFEYSDGTHFYGNEIQASTDVDASTSRNVTLDIESDAFLIQTDFITVTLNINNVVKEMPIEFGVEYSVNSDFTNSSTNAIENFDGIHNEGTIVITSYSAVAEPLMSGTQYYFRPYVKYADNTVTNGGTSIANFATN